MNITTILDFLRDSVWQFVGAALAALAIVVSLRQAKHKQAQKKLSYIIIQKSALLHMADDGMRGTITIQYDGKTLSEPWVLAVRFHNDGDIPITPTEFASSLNLWIDTEGEILTAEVSGKEPENLSPILSTAGRKIEISPCLINPTDHFDIRVIATKKIKDIRIESRIAGIKEVQSSAVDDDFSPDFSFSEALLLFTFLGFFILSGIALIFIDWKYSVASASIGLLVGFGYNLVQKFKKPKARTYRRVPKIIGVEMN